MHASQENHSSKAPMSTALSLPKDIKRGGFSLGHLSLSKVSIKNPAGDFLIKDLNLSVLPGEPLAIIGDEGAGKSMLLKAIAGNLPSGFKSEGDIRSGNIGYLPQMLDPAWHGTDCFEFFSLKTPKDEFDSGAWNDFQQIASILARLNLDADEMLLKGRVMGTLSGGEQTRIRIAKLLFEGKTTLLLDEPTNHLDLASIVWLENYIKTSGDPIIVVSHDETFLKNAVSNVLYVQKSKHGKAPLHRLTGNGYEGFLEAFEREVDESASAQDAFRREQRKQKQELNEARITAEARARNAKPQNAAEKASANRGFAKATQARSAIEARVSKEVAPERILADESIRISIPQGCVIPQGKVVLDIKIPELFAGEKLLGRNISLSVSGPEKLVIIGENGSGKSTLLHSIFEHLLTQKDKGIRPGFLPQNYFKEIKDTEATPLEYLSKIEADEQKIRSLLASLNLFDSDLTRPMKSLSGGQVGKTLLAALILKNSNVLLMDEPTNNLYPLSNRELRKFVKAFPGAVIAVSHDRAFVGEVGSRVLEMGGSGGERGLTSPSPTTQALLNSAGQPLT
jgi:ATP-binding cassette subfamily F protein 3